MKTVDIEAEKKEILRNIEELEAAENRKDIEGILELLAEDFVFVYRNAKIEGKEDTGEMLKESVKDFVSSKHVPLRVEVSSSGDVAWLFEYELNERARGEGVVETKQYALVTFRKVEGKWKQVAVCVT